MANVWPIGGGKGGSGKSFLTSSLGRLSAQQGKKTLVIDLDLGAANLHTLVGVPYPEKGLSDFIRKRIPRLEDAVVETPHANLFLISGAHDNFDIANMPYEQKIKTLRAIARLDYDRILLDLGAGTSFNTLDFFLISQNGIFITTPEPTSVENVYRLIRAIYFRRIRYCFAAADFKTLEQEADRQFGEGALNKPICMMKVIAQTDAEKYYQLKDEFAAYRFKLIINQMRRHDNTALGLQMSRMMEKHLGLHVEFAGNVAYDDHVHDAICQQVSFLERYAYTKTACDLREVGKLVVQSAGQQLSLHYMQHPYSGWPYQTPGACLMQKSFDQLNYYEMLDIQPAAAPFEIRHAYNAALQMYQQGALASYSFFTVEERRDILSLVEKAYTTLINDQARKDYDNELIRRGELEPRKETDAAPKKPVSIFDISRGIHAPRVVSAGRETLKNKIGKNTLIEEILARKELCGADLKRIRTELGVAIEQIAHETKIRQDHLRNMEADQVDRLPAAVFLKGFVKSYLKCLSLEPMEELSVRYMNTVARSLQK